MGKIETLPFESHEPESILRSLEAHPGPNFAHAESLVQPGRLLRSLEVAELAGALRVPEQPEISTGYADIYLGIWESPRGERVEVAVKELQVSIPKSEHSDLEALKSGGDPHILREVVVWSQTKHPNLHSVLGYRSLPRPRLISHWCRHGNVTDYLRENPGLSRLAKLRLIYQAACGLDHLHSQTLPICHAAIKPENVLINDRLEAALSDFGLSRVLTGLGTPMTFRTGEGGRGHFNYMAGELFTGETPRPDSKSDVYAFGGLILTVMSGKPPFFGLRDSVILFRVILGQSPKPEDHPGLPPFDTLWSVIHRCWDRVPEERPTMREVLHELQKDILHEGPISPSLSETDDPDHELSDMDLGTPDTARTGGILALPHSNLAHAKDPLSSISKAEETRFLFSRELSVSAGGMFRGLLTSCRAIPVIGEYIEAAAEVGLALVEFVQAMDRKEDMANSLESRTWKLGVSLERLKEGPSKASRAGSGDCIADVRRELHFIQSKIEEWRSSIHSDDAFSSCDHPKDTKSCEGKIREALEEMKLLVDLDTTTLMTELGDCDEQKRQRRLLDRLGDGKYGVQGNSIQDSICSPRTRVEILQRIDDWIRDTSVSDRVLWIRGMAGRGKSTIASTVAHSWKHRASCAIFHFRRGQHALNHRLVCALARQLGSSLVPEVKRAVLEGVWENKGVARQRLDEQFEVLLASPLAKLNHQPYPVIIVVDALDECDNRTDAVNFITLIDRHSPSLPANVKFLLTCRPEAPLLNILEPRRWHVEDLDSAADVPNDLVDFIAPACKQIREHHDLPADWPSSEEISGLVELSQGLFQWARNAITYLNNGSPVDRLQGLLRRSSMWSGLDDLYHQIFSIAFDKAAMFPERQLLLKFVVGTLVVAPHPISLEVVANLCGNDILSEMGSEDIMRFLRAGVFADLSSLLFVPGNPTEPIRLLHTSIRDFLVDKDRCGSQPYWINAIKYHQQLAHLCLDQMTRHLRKNICNISDPSMDNLQIQDLVQRKVSETLRYCCRAWSVHLKEGVQLSKVVSDEADVRVADFQRFSWEKVLCWLEVMSLLGATTEAINMAKHVHWWLLLNSGTKVHLDSLSSLWSDVQRFIITFSEPISFGALHIYISALPHCPKGTKLWECYASYASVQTLEGPPQPLTWPPNVWTRSVEAPVTTVAFSPDATLLASGSSDANIRLWDSQMGTPLGAPLTGHSDDVHSIVFSPNGKTLASGSSDKTIQLWDAQTGTPLGEPMTGHSGDVLSIVFSPDGKVLASGSSDRTIRLWDALIGASLGEPLAGHDYWVCAVAFSPNGKVLASGSSDETVRLWDVQTGTPLGKPLTGHHGWVRSVAFSPDGKVLVSGSSDRTVRLWNALTRAPLGQPLAGHSDWVHSVAFSPDGKMVVSGSSDQTIRLWDVQTGSPLGDPLTGHSDDVHSVAFSPNGDTLASGSSDRTVRLWDTRIGTTFGQPIAGHSGNVLSVVLSPDGEVLASECSDGTISLREVRTGRSLGEPLTSNGYCVGSIAFSPDGGILAWGSSDGTIRLWNTRTNTAVGVPLRGHNDWVRTFEFSPDGAVLASGYSDAIIILWDTQTGTPLGEPLTGHNDDVLSVAFAAGGKILASGSSDRTIRLWDVQNGVPLGDPLTGHSDWVRSISFSPEGKVLASGSSDETVRLWDVQTGEMVKHPLIGHSDDILSVTFSPDGRNLIAYYFGGRSVVWDTVNLQRRDIPASHLRQVNLYFQDHWVMFSSTRLLWLPPQYWSNPNCEITLCKGTLTVVHEGFLSIFDVSHAFEAPFASSAFVVKS